MTPKVLVIMPLSETTFSLDKKAVIKDIFGDVAKLPKLFTDDNDNFDLNLAIDELSNANLVIADLSYERPSCYYELGLAQSFGIDTFIIAQKGTTIHQHSGSVHYYSNLTDYRALLTQAYKKLPE